MRLLQHLLDLVEPRELGTDLVLPFELLLCGALQLGGGVDGAVVALEHLAVEQEHVHHARLLVLHRLHLAAEIRVLPLERPV